MMDELDERLKLDMLIGGTAIVRTNPDGSVERIAPEDFYRPADEQDDRNAVLRLSRRRKALRER